MLTSPQTRWRTVPGTALTLREWGGELVVFNHETGSTHLLDEFACTVLHQLTAADSGATAASLAAELTDEPSGPDLQECAQAVTTVLAEFARLGLARSEQP